MAGDDKKDQQKKVLELVQEAVKHDEELRKKYNVGDKFRFVRERLQDLLQQIEKNITSTTVVKEKAREAVADEAIVYVYLYNAQGINIRSWQNMLSPKTLYEYSVNRPIYTEKKYIETLLRSKSNKFQHAFIAVAVKPNDIVQATGDFILKDGLGNPLVKVKEGALHFDRLIYFAHNNQDYTVDPEGVLAKKA